MTSVYLNIGMVMLKNLPSILF